MGDGSGINTYWCNDCLVKMSMHARRVKKSPFCMICGETISIVRYEKRPLSEHAQVRRKKWTIKEMKELEFLVLEKGKYPAELASRFDRTPEAIRKRLYMMGILLSELEDKRRAQIPNR